MRLSDHERATSTVTLTDEQFAKIVELLTPGYEVAKLYLADYHRHELPAEEASPLDGGVVT